MLKVSLVNYYLSFNSYETTNGSYTYYFGVCAAPLKAKNKNLNIGIIQEKFDEITKNRSQFVLGRLNDVDLEGGGN